jgi:hypothetical protein
MHWILLEKLTWDECMSNELILNMGFGMHGLDKRLETMCLDNYFNLEFVIVIRRNGTRKLVHNNPINNHLIRLKY